MAFKCSKLSQNFHHPTQRNYSTLACRGRAEYMTFVKFQIFYSIADHHNPSYFLYFSECSTAKYILNIKCLSKSRLRNQFVILKSLYVFVTKYFCTLSNKKVPQVEAALWDSCVLLGTTKIAAKKVYKGTKRIRSGLQFSVNDFFRFGLKDDVQKLYGQSWDFIPEGGASLALFVLIMWWAVPSNYLTSMGGNSDNFGIFLDVC